MTNSLIVKGFLMATAVVGVAGRGAFAAEKDPAEKAIAEIQKLGGRVTLDKKTPGGPSITVSFPSTAVADAGREHLKGLTQLQTLILWDTIVTDAGLEHLKGLTQLQRLYLDRGKVTKLGVNELQKALPTVWISWSSD